MTHSELPSLRLKKGEERRLKQGHLWVYSNEVDTAQTPFRDMQAGQCVNIVSHQGKPLGSAYVNPHSLISARLYSRRSGVVLDAELIRRRLQQAHELRAMVYPQPWYRWCYGESDMLPGLVVDRFGEYLSVQISTAGMEQHLQTIIEQLVALSDVRGIVLRNDMATREQEGLPLYTRVGYGEVPDWVSVRENGAEFSCTLQSGQKTGWFYDHRDNRARLQGVCKDKTVLDVFSYLGAWGIEALVAGAAQAHFVDSSQPAMTQLREHARHNGVADRCHTHVGDAFDVLEQLKRDEHVFDIVVVDPPAFVKRRKDLAQGLHAYQRINQLALQLIKNNGLLISASCSQAVSAADLLGALRGAAKNLPLRLQIIAQGHQAMDHPIHPAMAETEYLKCIFCRVTNQ